MPAGSRCFLGSPIWRAFRVFDSSRSASCSLRLAHKMSRSEAKIGNNVQERSRGALIVLEGLDRSGKSSQSDRLVSSLKKLGLDVQSWRFPDRNTRIGGLISSYLANESQLDDRAVHLLFSANRWEKRSLMENQLKSGTTLIIDRYSHSGVAFSAAKGLDLDWCKAPECGLIAPDLVVYLDILPEDAAKRGNYGNERYEHLKFQTEVAQYYHKLQDETWKIINGNSEVESIEKELLEYALECVRTCKNKDLSTLWL